MPCAAASVSAGSVENRRCSQASRLSGDEGHRPDYSNGRRGPLVPSSQPPNVKPFARRLAWLYFSKTRLSTITMPLYGRQFCSQYTDSVIEVSFFRISFGSIRESVTHAGCANALSGTL